MNAKDYIFRINLLEYFEDIKDQDCVFAYDFNEVQQLFYSNNNNCVFLVGDTRLDKKQLVGHLIKSMNAAGKNNQEILFLDYNLPIMFELDLKIIINEFLSRNLQITQTPKQNLYLFINEIHFFPNWMQILLDYYNNYPNLKIVCTSSACPLVYEQIQAIHSEFIKIIILSDKNNSNIKCTSNGFGIYQHLKYNIKEDFIEIKGLTIEGKQQKEINIPPEIDGKPVKIIASGAFHDRNELTHIFLPDSIVMIGDYAFTKCYGLEDIHLPESLEYIGDNAFLNAKNLKTIINGNRINHIGNNAFFGTQWLLEQKNDFITLGNVLYKYQGRDSNITIPKNIMAITNWACSNNQSIIGVTIQNDRCNIGEGVFYDCINLKEVKGFSGNVESFTFAYCKNLNLIPIDGLENIGDYAFFKCESLSHIKIGSKKIGHCAFTYCNNLQVVEGIPTMVGKGAFYKCTRLNSLNFDSIQKLDDFAIYQTDLNEISINAQSIGDYSLSNNQSLKRITLNNITVIGEKILHGNTNLNELYIGGKYPLSYYFGDLNEYKIKTIEIRDEIIVDNVLRDYESLETLILNGIKYFGRWAFYGCKNLIHVKFSNDILEIGDWAFTNCEHLESIELPSSIQKIGMNAFRYCSKLKEIKLNSPIIVQFLVNAFYQTPDEKIFLIPTQILIQYQQDPLWHEYKDNLKRFY